MLCSRTNTHGTFAGLCGRIAFHVQSCCPAVPHVCTQKFRNVSGGSGVNGTLGGLRVHLGNGVKCHLSDDVTAHHHHSTSIGTTAMVSHMAGIHCVACVTRLASTIHCFASHTTGIRSSTSVWNVSKWQIQAFPMTDATSMPYAYTHYCCREVGTPYI